MSQASVPAEALQLFWTDEYRKSWGVKLFSTSSYEEIFQVLHLFPFYILIAPSRFFCLVDIGCLEFIVLAIERTKRWLGRLSSGC
jgi:hypothetical protein